MSVDIFSMLSSISAVGGIIVAAVLYVNAKRTMDYAKQQLETDNLTQKLYEILDNLLDDPKAKEKLYSVGALIGAGARRGFGNIIGKSKTGGLGGLLSAFIGGDLKQIIGGDNEQQQGQNSEIRLGS